MDNKVIKNLYIENHKYKSYYYELKTNIKKLSFISKIKSKYNINFLDNKIECIQKDNKEILSTVTFSFLKDLDNVLKNNSFNNIFIDNVLSVEYPFIVEILEEKYNIAITVLDDNCSINHIFSVPLKYIYTLNLHVPNLYLKESCFPFRKYSLIKNKEFETKEKLYKYVKRNNKQLIKKLKDSLVEHEQEIIKYLYINEEYKEKHKNLLLLKNGKA